MRAGGGLNGNEQPVVYIDGMRVVNDEIGGTGSNQLTTGGQGLSTLLDFNPDDIENIEILKGPAAATWIQRHSIHRNKKRTNRLRPAYI